MKPEINILVCFQVLPDLETLSPEDWVAGQDLTVDLRFAPLGWNCFDESALELGLRLAKTARDAGLQTSLTAASVGDRRVFRWMKTLYALGYDACIWQPYAKDHDFCAEDTAAALAQIAAGSHSDLILLGAKGGLGGSGQTAPLVAEYLNLPYYGGITALDMDGGVLKFEAVSGDSCLTCTASPPAVLAIGNTPSTMLPIPTLKARMAAASRETTSLPARPPGPVMQRLVGISPVHQSRAGRRMPDGTPEELAESMLDCLREMEGHS